MRKARIDFGAEVEFLEARLDAAVPGTHRTCSDARGAAPRPLGGRADQRREPDGPAELEAPVDHTRFSRAHAALARVTWADEPAAPLAALHQATLTGDEPARLLEYHRAHPAFPHEPTGDQFFDEAQWESYRKLGEHIARKLFRRPGAAAGPAPQSWWPDELV